MSNFNSKEKYAFSYLSRKCAIFGICTSVAFSFLHIVLLIHYEVTDGQYGDGFMLPLPLFSFIFAVFPLCALATLFNIISIIQGHLKFLNMNWILILLSLLMLPILLMITLFSYA